MPEKDILPKAYQRVKHRLFFAGLFLDAVFFLAAMYGGWSVALREFSFAQTGNFYVANGIYASVFFVALYVLHFPLRVFEGFVWEHQFSLSTQKFSQWLADDAKQSVLRLAVFLLTVEAVYAFLRAFPETWWVGAGVFWLFLTLVLARITPDVIIPLFYKYSPIGSQELRESVLKLFERSKIKVRDAYLVDFSSKTKKANAFICGLGQSRRVVLSDTLVAQFTIPEIETVVAHEIGHYKHHDILKLTVVNACTVFAGFYLVDGFLKGSLHMFGAGSLDDIAFFPVVALSLTVMGFLAMPLLNGFSRSLERAADAFSLQLTGKPADFISMMEKLGTMNLADFNPGRFTEWFFYSHPPVAKRIGFARGFTVNAKGV